MALTKSLRFRFDTSNGFSSFLFVVLGLAVLTGCQDDTELVRAIQKERQEKEQLTSERDHLGEAFNLLDQYIDLDREKAQRQIAYHLNRWSETKPASEAGSPEIANSIRDIVPAEQLAERLGATNFQPADADHLRDCYLFRSIFSWVDVELHEELLLTEWLDEQEDVIGIDEADNLRTATRLFDWTVRNIALVADEPQEPAPPGPSFPLGMKFRGAGYRQSDYQAVTRGRGDGLQRAGVFTQLCRQAGVPAAVLGTIDGTTGQVTPFCVGVLVGKEIYLFEPTLGIFVPGPDQVGIATLAQARRDAVILRRLGIAGLDQFTYPVKKENVQQCVALFNLLPEAISPRMQQLQSGLTGNRRMNVYVDADEMAKRFDAVTGISSVRIWDVPLLTEVYDAVCRQHAQRDPVFGFWFNARWSMLEEDYGLAKDLARARWRHLTGQFSDVEDEGIQGARSLYLAQRKPEFEIDDLRIDVKLQEKYKIRRSDLDLDGQQFEQQIVRIQAMLLAGKRTATYWLSLLQADDGRTETAASWIEKRVLDEQQLSFWVPAARFNLARLKEKLGQPDEAIEMYKREGEPQEHGNRIRARLLAKQQGG